MHLPEDRHPLLCEYLEHEHPDRVRSRCLSQGATTVLGKWPEHLTFTWMMGVVGLVSLITCFLLAVFLLIVSSTSSHHHAKRNLVEKCERNEHVIQLVHMKNLEDLTIHENATYFVEIYTNETKKENIACSLETYLNRTSLPVFLVSIFPQKSDENLTMFNELEKKYSNLKTITFDRNAFFNKTVFSNFQSENPKFLGFLAKVLVSWNVGGTVLDSRVKTLREYRSVLPSDDKTMEVGTLEEDVLLLSSKRFCHVFIFDVLKTVTETKDTMKLSELDVIKAAEKRFCHKRKSCSGLKLVSKPEFCSAKDVTDDCIFYKTNESNFTALGNVTRDTLCPIVKSLL